MDDPISSGLDPERTIPHRRFEVECAPSWSDLELSHRALGPEAGAADHRVVIPDRDRPPQLVDPLGPLHATCASIVVWSTSFS